MNRHTLPHGEDVLRAARIDEKHDEEGGRLARVEDARAHATAREHPANARSAFQEENGGEWQDGARKEQSVERDREEATQGHGLEDVDLKRSQPLEDGFIRFWVRDVECCGNAGEDLMRNKKMWVVSLG